MSPTRQQQQPERTAAALHVGSPTGSASRKLSSSSSGGASARRRRPSRRLMSITSAGAAGIAVADDKHKISNTEAMTHMIKATIGGGFLAMPEAFHNAGVLIGVVGTFVLGLAVLNMMSFIVRCSQTLRSGKYAAAVLAERQLENGRCDDKELILPPMDYPATVAAVFQRGARGRFARYAPFFRNLTSATLVTTYYGVNIIYVCIVAGTCKQLVDQYTADAVDGTWAYTLHGLSIRWYPAVTALLVIPVGMVRLMKYLVPFSVVANACLVFGSSAVFYFIVAGHGPVLPPEQQAKLLVLPATRWMLFAGSTMCSMEGVGMLLHIENAMRRPLEFAGPPSYTLHRSMLVIMLLNGSLGLFGYLRYGELCAGSISLNLPPNNRLSDVIKIIIALGILFTYGLQLTVTADLAWQGLRSKLAKSTKSKTKNGNGTDDDENDDDDEWSSKSIAYYYTMRLFLILGTVAVATAVPDIGPLVSLVGSVGFSVLGLLMPIAMEIVWYWYPKERGDDDDDDGGGGGDHDHGHDDDGRGQADGAKKPAATAVGRDRSRRVRRIVRHVKNALLFTLALSTLVGGAFYNVRDIVDNAFGTA